MPLGNARADMLNRARALADAHLRLQAARAELPERQQALRNQIFGFGRFLVQHENAMNAHQAAVLAHGDHLVQQLARFAPPPPVPMAAGAAWQREGLPLPAPVPQLRWPGIPAMPPRPYPCAPPLRRPDAQGAMAGPNLPGRLDPLMIERAFQLGLRQQQAGIVPPDFPLGAGGPARAVARPPAVVVAPAPGGGVAGPAARFGWALGDIRPDDRYLARHAELGEDPVLPLGRPGRAERAQRRAQGRIPRLFDFDAPLDPRGGAPPAPGRHRAAAQDDSDSGDDALINELSDDEDVPPPYHPLPRQPRRRRGRRAAADDSDDDGEFVPAGEFPEEARPRFRPQRNIARAAALVNALRANRRELP